MTIIQRVDNLKKLWMMAVPQVPLPTDSQLLLWCSQNRDAELEHAVMRLRSKVHQGKLQGEAGRYVTSVLNAERRRESGRVEVAQLKNMLHADRRTDAA